MIPLNEKDVREFEKASYDARDVAIALVNKVLSSWELFPYT